jgi:uncharacterized protein (TIRG00374 family)
MDQDSASIRSGTISLRNLIRPLLLIIPLALAGNLIYVFLTSDSSILREFARFKLLYFVGAILIVYCPWFAHSSRIMLWTTAFQKRLDFAESFKIAIATDIGAAITPSVIGGSYAKLGLLTINRLTPGEAALVTLLGTIEDGVFFAVAIPICIVLTGSWNSDLIIQFRQNAIAYLPAIGVAAAVILTGLVILRIIHKRRNASSGTRLPAGSASSRLRHRIVGYKHQFSQAFSFIRKNHKGTFALCVLLSGAGWICRYSVITLLVTGLGFHADPILFFLLQWVVFTLMTLFPTPGAIGGAEISFALIYRGLVPAGIIPVLTGVWRFVTFYLIMVTGALLVAFSGLGNSVDGGRRVCENRLEDVRVP